MCEKLSKLKADAVAAFAEAKRVRRQRDLSFQEDAELSRDGYKRVDALVKHLLVGHDGKPCPAGDRPIVSSDYFRAAGAFSWAAANPSRGNPAYRSMPTQKRERRK
jgi:hypothetical protein